MKRMIAICEKFQTNSSRILGLSLLLFFMAADLVFGQGQQRRSQSQGSRRSQQVKPMQELQVASPDGQVMFSLSSNAERLMFSMALGSNIVIEPSPILMNLDGYDLSSGVVIKNVERYQINETYPWYGAHSTATNYCNGLKLMLAHDLSFIDYTLEVRVFNDGVGFRHVMPGEENALRVPDERTTFIVPAGSTVWYGGLQSGHYESDYLKKDISDVQPGEWAGPPLTLQLAGHAGYASLTEANLVNYSGMGLEADGRRGWTVGLGHRQPLNYPFELRYGREEGKRLGKLASVKGTITTPWRVVLLGRDLNSLVNSTVVPNLCPAPDPKYFPEGLKTSWVRPGRGVWRYVDGGPSGLEGMKTFSRLAGQLGFEHHIIEGFWSRWTIEERKELAAYSKQQGQGVGIWFWRHSNQLRTPEAQDEFFKMLEDCGVTGAKIDFFDHEAKELVDLYETLLRKAAEHHLLLVFHGANKPTGRERTWPNEMVREAIRGMEASRLTERARHQTILPFTRYLAGPADYTTMIFSQRRADTTWAHQIASMSVYSSPLLTIAANPQSILDNPAVEVIKGIPAVWDETIVLPGSEIGELAAFARRTGGTWFVAVMNGPSARTVKVPLAFLGGGEYKATLVRDHKDNDAAVAIENTTGKQSDALSLELRPGGGFIARFTRK